MATKTKAIKPCPISEGQHQHLVIMWEETAPGVYRALEAECISCGDHRFFNWKDTPEEDLAKEEE